MGSCATALADTHETGPDSGNCLVFSVGGIYSDLFVLGLSKSLNVYANQIVYSSGSPSRGLAQQHQRHPRTC